MVRGIITITALLGASIASPVADGERSSSRSAIFNPNIESQKAVPKGYKVQYVGHSFHFFLPAPMASLAKEAGIRGHQSLGMDFLPASYPCQHWNKNPNPVKNVLRAGKADVLTLSTRELAPDECIGKFAKLAVSSPRLIDTQKGEVNTSQFQGNKKIRVMVQETWLPVSLDPNERCTPYRVKPGERDSRINKCSNRDGTTVESNERTRKGWELIVRNKLRTQLQGLNKQFGANITSLVTTWDGIISLRNAVIKGQVPGVKKQSSLFVDGLGHPQKPLRDFVTYMWFSAMYGVNPLGFKSLAGAAPAGQAKILQELAWKTVKSEPLNGISSASGFGRERPVQQPWRQERRRSSGAQGSDYRHRRPSPAVILEHWIAVGNQRRAAVVHASPDATPATIATPPPAAIATPPPQPGDSMSASWHSLPPDRAASVRENVHALSLLNFHAKAGVKTPDMVQSKKEEKHHIKILNGLALLLIAEPKSDIAAVTQWRTGSEVKLLWSKNERINDTEELQYIETLLRMILEGSDGLKILGFVIRRCHAKIHFRITKLAKSFKESMARMSNLWGLDENIPAHRELIDQLLKTNYCRGRTVIGSLDAFTHEMVDIKNGSDVDAFLEIIYFCWLLTSEITQIANLKLVLNDLQVRYLKKVGDYWRIVMRFSDLKKKLHGASISVEQIFPPEAEMSQVTGSSLDRLTIRSRERALDDRDIKIIDNWRQVEEHYPHAQEGHPGLTKIKFTQHCELTLALWMTARIKDMAKPHTKRIEIGVSKSCCQWCVGYLGWLMPPKGPKWVTNIMAERIERQLDEVINRCQSSRRSDSVPEDEEDVTVGHTEMSQVVQAEMEQMFADRMG